MGAAHRRRGWRSVGQVHSCGNHMVRGVGMHGRSVGTIGDYSTGAGQMILPLRARLDRGVFRGTSWDVILKGKQVVVFWANDPVKNLQVGWNTRPTSPTPTSSNSSKGSPTSRSR